jgi:hypothetical protein
MLPPVPKPMPLAWLRNASAFEQGHSNADNPTHVPAYAKQCNIISYACHLKGQCIVPCCIVPLKAVSLRREMAYADSDVSTDLAASTPLPGFVIACICARFCYIFNGVFISQYSCRSQLSEQEEF